MSEGCLGVQVVFGWCVVVSACCLGCVLEMSGVSSGVWGGVRWCFGGVLDTFLDPPPGHTGIQDPGSNRVKGCISSKVFFYQK